MVVIPANCHLATQLRFPFTGLQINDRHGQVRLQNPVQFQSLRLDKIHYQLRAGSGDAG